jgi:hypothetical protein
MERAFGRSFEEVILHTDQQAALTADRIGASAYTVGEHIVFGSGEYAPQKTVGRMLLAHELAHVVQQRNGGSATAARSGADPAGEADADRAAGRVVLGCPATVRSAAPVSVARADKEKSWKDVLWDAAKAKLRDEVEGALGSAEGVAGEVTGVVDTIAWLPYAEIDAINWAVDKAADAGGLSEEKRKTLRVVAHTVAQDNAPILEPIRDLAKSVGAVDPVTGAPALTPLVTRAADAADKLIGHASARAGLQPEQGLLTVREQHQIGTAVGVQVGLSFIGVKEVQLALKVVGGIGAAKAIITAAERDPEGYVKSVEFWTAIGNAALYLIGLHSSVGGKKLVAYLVDVASLTLTTAPPVIKFVGDLANANGPDREEILHQDLLAVTRAAVEALRQIIQHGATLRKPGSRAPVQEPGDKPPSAPAATAPPKAETTTGPESAPPGRRPAPSAPVTEPAEIPPVTTPPPASAPAASPEAAAGTPPASLPPELGEEIPATRPIVGQKLGARSADSAPESPPTTRPARSPEDLAREREVVVKMQADRRENAIKAFDDLPDLKAKLRSSAKVGGGDLVDLAANSPTMMREMWAGWQANTAKRKAAGEPPLEFESYVKARQTEARGIHGERTDAFGRGPKEIMVVPPGRVNERGIDSVSFAPDSKGGRIKLLDNKALRAGATVTKVSALQQNIAGNLEEIIPVVAKYAAETGVPPVIKDVVLPRLQAASQAVNAHVANWQQANPGKPLTDPVLQAQIGQILDQHGIDRIVTTAGGGANVRLGRGLRQQGVGQE